MSFHGGTGVMVAVIAAVKARVPAEAHRREIYEATFEALRNQDWHDGLECAGIDDVFDRLLVEEGNDAADVAEQGAWNRRVNGYGDMDEEED